MAAAQPKLHVLGEPFYVEVEEGSVFIRHRQWSLLGEGPSLGDAFKDLVREASMLWPVLEQMPIAEFDADLLGLYRFALRFARINA